MVYRADVSSSYKAAVKKFDGSSWVQVGVNGFSPTAALNMHIAIDGLNVPYVCFKSQITNKISVMKFDGSAWVNVGLPDFSAGDVQSIAIAIDPSNVAYVAYQDVFNGNNATVMKFDGTSWVLVGAAGFSAGGMYGIDMAIDNTGKPYVVYIDNAISAKATVKSFDGSTWQNVGTAAVSSGQAWDPDIIIDQNNTPFVGFRDDGVSSKAVCKMFNGTSWDLVGANGFSAGLVSNISLAVSSTGVVYAFFGDGTSSNKGTAMEFCESGSTINESNCNTYTSPSGLYTWTSSGTYTDTLSNSKGCDSIITINLTITGSDLTVTQYQPYTCIGDTNVVFATMSGTPTFTWDNGLGVGSQHTISPITNTTYQVIADDGAGCVDTAEIIMDVHAKPALTITISDTIVCQGDSVLVTNSGADSYNWEWPLIDTLQSQWVVPPYSYHHYYISGHNTYCTTLDSVLIQMNTGPSSGSGFNGTLMYLTSTNFTTEWYYNGNLIVGENGYDYTATQNGTYEVVMTDSLGCSNSHGWTVTDIGLSLEEMTAKDVRVFPNPFKSSFIITTSTYSRAEVYSINGEKLFESPLVNENTELFIDNQAPGTYLLVLSNDEEVIYHKIVKN